MGATGKEYVDDLQDELDRLSVGASKSVNCDQAVLKVISQRLGELLREGRTKELATLINSNMVGVFIVGQGSQLQYSNARAREILGSEAQIKNLLASGSDVFYLADQITICGNHLPWLRALTGQHVDGDLILIRPKVDSGDKWIEVCALPQRQHGEDAISAAILLIIDSTEYVQSEHRIRQIKQALQERLVHTATEALIKGAPASVDKRRALLADDMQINQLLLTWQLNELGFTVHIANNGKEAVEAAAHNKYDIICLDCEMPIMDGYMAARAIRAAEHSNARTPILALSDYSHASDRERFIAAGSDDYMQKSWDLDLLRQAIDALLKDKGTKSTVDRSLTKKTATDQNQQGEQGEKDSDPANLSPRPHMPELAALSKLYGEESLQDTLALFFATAENSLECIQAALADRDARACHHSAYCLKGPATLLGADKMAKLCEEIAETAIRAKWFDAEDHFAELRSASRSLRKSLQPDTAGGAKQGTARRKTKTMALSLDLLEQRVGKKAAVAMAHAFKAGTANIMEQMAASIRKYDYDQLQKDARTLAGCCASIFIAKDLRGLSLQLEALCNEQHVDWIEVAVLFDRCAKSYSDTVAVVEAYLEAAP